MADDQPRSKSGEFEDKVTENDILALFKEADAPVLTAAEIAEQLPLTRQAVNYRLKQLQEQGLVGRKEVGARAVVWWQIRCE